VAVVEDEKELAAAPAESLETVRATRGKIPEVALLDVVDESAAFEIETGYPASALSYEMRRIS
jgi:hypothetical protein